MQTRGVRIFAASGFEIFNRNMRWFVVFAQVENFAFFAHNTFEPYFADPFVIAGGVYTLCEEKSLASVCVSKCHLQSLIWCQVK